MNKEKMIEIIRSNKYYTINDLRYNQKIGILLSKNEFDEFLRLKDDYVNEKSEIIKKLSLKTYNSKHCFYVNGKYILENILEYNRLLLSDLKLNQSFLFERNSIDIMVSRLYSEIEGTLNVENVPTTYSHIVEVDKKENLTEQNDVIVKNMLDAVKYIIEEKPEFNKENLFKLYNILSNNCLPDEKKLKEGYYYRDDKVYIGKYEGADCNIIDSCMDSLFEFANDDKNIEIHEELLPYICHYYILYIHPYFDYNGRTARMVSFWLSYINNIISAPYFMSEAINENKQKYYQAISESRDTNNDLTYFLGYILETAIEYSFVYKNIEEMKKTLMKTGDTLTPKEWVYVKKILVHNSEDYFNYKLFLEYINSEMTKQGAFKILNNLNKYNILEKSKNRKGEIIFKLNQELITYKYNK